MIEKIFNLEKGPIKLVLIIFIVSTTLIFAPNYILEHLSLSEFKIEYKKFIGISCAVSTMFLIISILFYLWSQIIEYFQELAFKKSILKNIRDLSIHEVYVLREFFLQSKTTIQMPPTDESVVSLENKHLIYKASNSGTVSMGGIMWPYSLNTLVKEKLTYELLHLKEVPNKEDQEKLFWERPEWTRGNLL